MGAGFGDGEGGEQHGPGGEGGQRGRGAPPDGVGTDDTEHQQPDSAGREDRAEHVQPLAPGGSCSGGHAGENQRESRRHDRQVDQHHPAPPRVLGQQPARQHAERSARGVHRAPHPERADPPGSLGEGGGEHRQRGRGGRGGTQALPGAGGDQVPGCLGQPARQRAQPEDGQA